MIKKSNLVLLKEYLIKKKLDYFILNRTDEFLNEYIASYAERLSWVTKFSGSAGRALIGKTNSQLFVDGRYTFQAKKEIDQKSISLNHLNNFWKVFKLFCKPGKKIAIDPSLHTINEVIKIQKYITSGNSELVFLKSNPVDDLWQNQPQKKYSKIFDHSIKFSGVSRKLKIELITS